MLNTTVSLFKGSSLQHISLISLTALVLLAGACATDEPLGYERQGLDHGPANWEEPRDFARASMVMMEPAYEQELVQSGALDAIAAEGTTLVYMNRTGGVFTPGQSNSRTNRSTLVSQTVNFPAANISDADWSTVMSCIQGQFSRFNVEITDVDPGDVPHYESVIGGNPGTLNSQFGSNVGGVSPFTSNCDMIPNSIVFTFSNNLPNNPQIVCQVAAQEIAHSFGLDHEYLCEDPMSYLSGCGAKSFQDVDAPCGEGAPRDCAIANKYNCGYARQNSVALLTQRLGAAVDPVEPVEPVEPLLASITTPANGATVASGFEVRAEVSDASSVELRIDGKPIATLSSGPYLFATPENLAGGTHILEISVSKDGQTEVDSVSITLVQGSTGADEDEEPMSPSPEPSMSEEDEVSQLVTGGCAVAGSHSSFGLIMLGLALLTLRRRRENCFEG